MALAMNPDTLVNDLRRHGLSVVEYEGWKTYNRNHKGPWGPLHGVMLHHTVTSGAKRTVEICRKGYEGLPGPLCHGVITKDGTVHMIGWGRANHAGMGDDDVLRAVIAEGALPPDNEANTDGNRHFYGFECENLGTGKDPWPAAQLDAMALVSYVLCRHHRWTQRSVIAHANWQPGKVDPAPHPGIINGVRTAVGALLRPAPKPPVPPAPVPPGKPLTLEQVAARLAVVTERVSDLEEWRNGKG